jgi:hypothetical protein
VCTSLDHWGTKAKPPWQNFYRFYVCTHQKYLHFNFIIHRMKRFRRKREREGEREEGRVEWGHASPVHRFLPDALLLASGNETECQKVLRSTQGYLHVRCYYQLYYRYVLKFEPARITPLWGTLGTGHSGPLSAVYLFLGRWITEQPEDWLSYQKKTDF